MAIFCTCFLAILYLVVGMMIPPLIFQVWEEGCYWYYDRNKWVRTVLKYTTMLIWPAILAIILIAQFVAGVWSEIIDDFVNM